MGGYYPMTFNIYQLDNLDLDEAEPVLEDYQDEIIELFANSTEGQNYLETHSDMGGWIGHLIYYGYSYEGFTLPQMTEDDVALVLEELLPRKISLFEPEDADDAIPELIAFWQFLKREYQLSDADDILEYLHDIEPKFRDIMNDSSKFGMAKSFFMMGQKAGFDMTTQEGLEEFSLHYNAKGAPQLAAEATEREELFPTLPNFDLLSGSDNEVDKGFHSPPSAAKKAKQKKRRKMAKASRKRNRQKRK